MVRGWKLVLGNRAKTWIFDCLISFAPKTLSHKNGDLLRQGTRRKNRCIFETLVRNWDPNRTSLGGENPQWAENKLILSLRSILRPSKSAVDQFMARMGSIGKTARTRTRDRNDLSVSLLLVLSPFWTVTKEERRGCFHVIGKNEEAT